MDKTCRKAKKRFDIFSNMVSSCNEYLKYLEKENPQDKEHFEKIRKDCQKLYMVYRKRMLEKFYEVYGGPTPFEEPVDDIKLYPETYKECLKEQDTLLNILRCSIRYLDMQEFADWEVEKYFKIIKKYKKVYYKYQKDIQKRIEERGV